MYEFLIFTLCTCCGTLIGCYFSGRLSRRCSTLKAVLNLLERMEIYIRYNRYKLSEIFRRLGKEQCLFASDELYEAAESGLKFYTEWHRCVMRLDSISKCDADVLDYLGEGLGKSDTDSQLALLDTARQQLECCLNDAQEQKNRKGRLFRTLGILLGAAAGIAAL